MRRRPLLLLLALLVLGGLGAEGSCNIAPFPVITSTLVTLESDAEPANTPGTPGVDPALVGSPNLVTQFGGSGFSLNNGLYSRWRRIGPEQTPDAILIVVAGFGGGSNNFKILAEELIGRVQTDHGMRIEVWGFHRRSNQLEDREGSILAATLGSADAALDWYYGAQLGLSLHPILAAGPNRRAFFYNNTSDIPFLANWTSQVFSQDLDVVVEAARAAAKNQNVFLAGHSAGTGFVARYASTDFNLTGVGPAEPGYAKVRGLALLEGGGGRTGGDPLTDDAMDRIIAKFDGGQFGAVRDNAARCVDGTTACTIDTEAVDCAGQVPPLCTEPATAYVGLAGPPGLVAASEPIAIQGASDPDSGINIIQASGAPFVVPALLALLLLPTGTVHGALGTFLDDDGFAEGSATATALGAPGPVVGGAVTWLDLNEGPLPASVLPDNGPPPTTLPFSGVWGQEVEVVEMDRFVTTFTFGESNAADWYFATSGLSVTSAPGRCDASVCTVGNVGAACVADGDCTQSISLDSSALSVGRSRPDIVNLTQAGNIDVPVICFGGSNGLVPVPGEFVPFAQSIGPCTAPSCDGTPRIVDVSTPSEAFPTFGDVDGGFEAHISEGFAHNDVVAASDGPANQVVGPLSDFIARNAE